MSVLFVRLDNSVVGPPTPLAPPPPPRWRVKKKPPPPTELQNPGTVTTLLQSGHFAYKTFAFLPYKVFVSFEVASWC